MTYLCVWGNIEERDEKHYFQDVHGFQEYQIYMVSKNKDFPCGSAGEESTCNVGDVSSMPGLGRSPGEGKGYPLQYSVLGNSMNSIVHGVKKSRTQLSGFHFIPSLVAEMVKNLPAMQETWVQFLGQEDPLEKEIETHSSILAWRIPWREEPGRLQSMGSQESVTP